MTTRLSRSCRGCSHRHVRCSKRWPCLSCVRAGFVCEVATKYQFKFNRRLKFASDQTWVNTRKGQYLFIDDAYEDSPILLDYNLENREDISHVQFLGIQSPGIPDGAVPTPTAYSDRQIPPPQTTSRDAECLFPLNETDVVFVKHFMQNLLPWFDYSDIRRLITVEVTRRLGYSKPLLYAVLAVSASQLNALRQYDPIVSDEYYQKCLEHLIPALSAGNDALQEDILAATVILRLRAEFEVPLTGIDDQTHLFGTQALLSEYKTTKPLSQFQTAIAWVGLRQEIRLAFMAQRKVEFPLNCFQIDWGKQPSDDSEWANRMVYQLAEVLNACCGDVSLSMETYELLSLRSEAWVTSVPVSFLPVYYQPSSTEKRVPCWDFINHVAAIGYQHHLLSKLALAFYHPATHRLGPRCAAVNQQMNDTIERTVLDICGIGLSNSDCASVIGMASMVIRLCKDRFSDDGDQEIFQRVVNIARDKHAWQN